MPNTWNELNEINENVPYEYDNDTDFSLEELEQIDWVKVSTEGSNFSSMSAITYTNPENTLAKKIFSDGFVEYYELA